jgi:hypothetical protein
VNSILILIDKNINALLLFSSSKRSGRSQMIGLFCFGVFNRARQRRKASPEAEIPVVIGGLINQALV